MNQTLVFFSNLVKVFLFPFVKRQMLKISACTVILNPEKKNETRNSYCWSNCNFVTCLHPAVTYAAAEHQGRLFWIICKWPKLLTKAGCLQLIQNSAICCWVASMLHLNQNANCELQNQICTRTRTLEKVIYKVIQSSLNDT